MTIREHWQHHADHAGRYQLLKGPRYAWGAVACALDFLYEDLFREWVLKHPSRAFGAAAALTIIWFFLFGF